MTPVIIVLMLVFIALVLGGLVLATWAVVRWVRRSGRPAAVPSPPPGRIILPPRQEGAQRLKDARRDAQLEAETRARAWRHDLDREG